MDKNQITTILHMYLMVILNMLIHNNA